MLIKDSFGQEKNCVRAFFRNRAERSKAFEEVMKRRTDERVLRQRKYLKLYNSKPENKRKMAIQNHSRYLIRKGKVKINKTCSFCGSKKNIVIHHLNYSNNPKDWLVLCGKCHAQIHSIERMQRFDKKLILELPVCLNCKEKSINQIKEGSICSICNAKAEIKKFREVY